MAHTYTDPISLPARLTDQLRESGRLEVRNYLGMSAIGQCPCKLFHQYFDGPDQSDRMLQYSYTGYMHESDLKLRLARLGVARVVPEHDGPNERGIYQCGTERALVAPWDVRFQGHTDGETTDGRLLELKSINAKGFAKLAWDHAPKTEHLWQVHAYMLYGNYPACLMVYVNRDTFEHLAFAVRREDELCQRVESKARQVLAAIDVNDEPQCECGWCHNQRGN